ncbi:DUF1993 domain-containing protein [Haliea sp. E17]|uniref:DUF1993 domain-containing protein n=1 Tax=Haliea sp. E17 TaxID=3401576 RepID=UPI003AAEF2F3
MPVSLYQATVPTFIQVTGAIRGVLDKAENYCEENSLDPNTLVEGRLIADMWTFAFQVQSVAAHSFGAIEGVRRGLFTPTPEQLPTDFASLKQRLDDALGGLRAVDPEELDSYIGKEVRFEAGHIKFGFIAEDFLFSFSQPNFFFHATTAYDILRAQGLPMSKLDFLAGMRLKQDPS